MHAFAEDFEARFCLLDGGPDELLDLLSILKSTGFTTMVLENIEAFHEPLLILLCSHDMCNDALRPLQCLEVVLSFH